MTQRQAATDVVVDGVFIPKGTIVLVVHMVPHHSERIWGPTVEDFNPDRWDDLPREAADPYAFQAFATGPRICIGKQFAILEYKTIMIELLRRFEFESIGRELRFERGAVSLRPDGGMPLKVRPIN